VLLGDFNIDLLGKSTANRLLKSFALVLSKVNCACSVFHPLPAFQMKRLQRLQKLCTCWICHKKVRRIGGRCKVELVSSEREH